MSVTISELSCVSEMEGERGICGSTSSYWKHHSAACLPATVPTPPLTLERCPGPSLTWGSSPFFSPDPLDDLGFWGRFHSRRSDTLSGQIHLSKFWENEMHNSKVTEEWPGPLQFNHWSLFYYCKVKCIWPCKMYLTSECIWPIEFRFHEAQSFFGKSILPESGFDFWLWNLSLMTYFVFYESRYFLLNIDFWKM